MKTIFKLLASGALGGSSSVDVSGTQAIWSVRKLNKSYSGPAVRIKNNSTLAESDFGFSGGVWDFASIDTWLAGNVGKVMTIYDQKGSANLTQTTLANMPFYQSASYATNGKPCAFFNRRDSGLDHFFNVTFNFNSDDLAFLHVGMGQPSFLQGTASTDILFYNGGNPGLFTISDNVVFRTGTKSISFYNNSAANGACSISQSGVKMLRPGSSSYFFDQQAETLSALSTQRTPTTGILGKRSNAQFKKGGVFQELVLYNSAYTDTTLKANQKSFFATTKNHLIVADGTSLDFGYTSTNTFNEDISTSWPYKVAAKNSNLLVLNFGVPSATIQSMMAQGNWVNRKRALLDTTLTPFYIIGGPTNNVSSAESTATITGRIDTLIADIKATAPNTIFIFYTIYSRTDIFANPAFQTVGDAVNDYLLSLVSVPNKIYVVDLRSSVLGKPSTNAYTNTTYFDADGIHLKAAGYQVVADAVYSFMTSNGLV